MNGWLEALAGSPITHGRPLCEGCGRPLLAAPGPHCDSCEDALADLVLEQGRGDLDEEEALA